jgi:hypothetical protein
VIDMVACSMNALRGLAEAALIADGHEGFELTQRDRHGGLQY